MSLSRKSLKAMGLSEEQVDFIIEDHSETVNALKEQRDAFKADADKLAEVQAELDGLKAKGDGGWQKKYEDEHSAFEAYKSELTEKETKATKTEAVRQYFTSKGITGKNLEIAMRGVSAEIAATELEDGKIKDTSNLDALIAGDYAGLVGVVETKGANVPNPQTSGNVDTGKMTDAEYFAYQRSLKNKN